MLLLAENQENSKSSYCFLLLLSYQKNPPCQRHFCANKCQWYDEHEINQIPCENIIDSKTSVGVNQNRDEMHTEDYHRISSHPRKVFSNSTFSNFVRETDCQDCCGKSPDYVKRVTPVSVASHGEKTRENASQPNTPPYCQNCIRGFICLQHIASHVKHQRSAACQYSKRQIDKNIYGYSSY